MAEYKNANVLKHVPAPEFDAVYHPAVMAPFSGIYRCAVCGHEAVSTRGHRLPPQNHHVHAGFAPIAWQMVVATNNA